MEEKICPIMSKTVSESYSDYCPSVIISRFVEIECKKERCQFWIKTPKLCDCVFIFQGLDKAISF